MTSTLLFIDDEVRVLDGYRRTLRAWPEQWQAVYCQSAQEALEHCERDAIDVVVTDVHMPGLSGMALLQQLRSQPHTRDIPVIVVTGANDKGLKGQALDQGASDLLQKPFEAAELRARLRNSLQLKCYADQLKAHAGMLERSVHERTQQLARSRVEVVLRLAKAGECRDDDTGNHVMRVGAYSRILASQLGMEESYCETIYLAATLHDIGKIGVPDAVLRKPGKLDDDEWHAMRQHCELGRSILMDTVGTQHPDLVGEAAGLAAEDDQNPLIAMAAQIAACHHERWDGSGYPHGLAGHEIPLAARITAIADVYDALRSERPYKAAFSVEKSVDILADGSGTHFEPNVHQAFVEAIEDIWAAEDFYRDRSHSAAQQQLQLAGHAASY